MCTPQRAVRRVVQHAHHVHRVQQTVPDIARTLANPCVTHLSLRFNATATGFDSRLKPWDQAEKRFEMQKVTRINTVRFEHPNLFDSEESMTFQSVMDRCETLQDFEQYVSSFPMCQEAIPRVGKHLKTHYRTDLYLEDAELILLQFPKMRSKL